MSDQTDKWAAEAWNECCDAFGEQSSEKGITAIKAAIEKAYAEGKCDMADTAADMMSDHAAQGSEQGVERKALQRIADMCRTPTDPKERWEWTGTVFCSPILAIASQALSQRPTPATAKHEIDEQEHCERCGEDWPTLGSQCNPATAMVSENICECGQSDCPVHGGRLISSAHPLKPDSGGGEKWLPVFEETSACWYVCLGKHGEPVIEYPFDSRDAAFKIADAHNKSIGL